MAIDDIFENDKWDEKSQQLFWDKIKRKRAHKLSFVTRKAITFLRKNDPNSIEIGISILLKEIDEYFTKKNEILEKKKYPRAYKTEIIEMIITMSKAYFKLGEFDKALSNLETAEEELFLAEKNKDWNCRTSFFSKAYLLKAEIAILNFNAELAKEYVQKAIDSGGTSFMQLAIIETKLAHLTQDFTKSDANWSDWYSLSENSYHLIEAMEYISATTDTVSLDFWDAAETFIVNHNSVLVGNGKNKASLKQVDKLIKFPFKFKHNDKVIENWDKQYLKKCYIPEFGSYIGETINNELNGKWLAGKTLMSSRIILENGIKINPFMMAYDVVYYKRRLSEDVFDKINDYKE